MSNTINSIEEFSKKYQEEILRRGSLARSSGHNIDNNPYATANHQWLDSKFDALRLLKNAPNSMAIETALSKLSDEQQKTVLNNNLVVELATRIEGIRESAAQIWEQGWLRGHSPNEPLDLSDMIDEDTQ